MQIRAEQFVDQLGIMLAYFNALIKAIVSDPEYASNYPLTRKIGVRFYAKPVWGC